MIAEIPLGVVALEVVLCEGRCRITCTVEAELRVYTFDAWDGLWHDAEGAISELFDAPELFVASCIGRNGCNLLVGCSCKGSLSAFNRNLEIWIAEITASCVNGGDGPTLVRTEHIVTDAGRNISLRPGANHLR